MSTLNLLLSIFVFAVVALAVIFLFFPDTKEKKRQESLEKRIAKATQGKDWQEVALKLERHVQGLRQDLASAEGAQKKLERDLAVERLRTKKLKEKVSQEKQWLDKEQNSMERQDSQLKEMKEALSQAQDEREREYAEKLRFERELRERHQELKALEKEHRELTARLMHAEEELITRKEKIVELERVHRELVKETDEKDWIAKSEYDKLEKLIAEKDKEIERLRRRQTDLS